MLVVPISFFSGGLIMLWRVEGDFTAGKLTPTDFDFLRARLALSSMSRVMFATLNRGTCCGCNCSFKIVKW